ncbi:hypothetical protein [Ensifer sp. MJa1]|uniref:hypothetical protein n=1 Tax=Ensifer sp. MJa1 TaxID=2919888 RepID=UPI00300BE6CF
MVPVDIDPTSELPAGPFWSPPIAVNPTELSPSLWRQINDCEDSHSFRAYVVQVFADRVGPPEAAFEIAFSRKCKRACVVFEAVPEADSGEPGGRVLAVTDPIWVAANSPRAALDAAFQAFVERCSD